MKRARRAEPKRETPRTKRAGSGLTAERAAISGVLSRALTAWADAQATISKMLSTSFRAWVVASTPKAKPKPAAAAPKPVKAEPGVAPHGMEAALQSLRSGTITFAAFERATKGDWDRLATMLFKRWPLPAGVEIADVRQELLMAVVRRDADGLTLLTKWSDDKGVALARFVTWNAIVWASRWIHDQRGVFKTTENKGSRGRDRGNVARPVSGFEREDGSSALPEITTAPEQGEGRAFEETMAAIVSKLRSSRDRTVLGVYLDVGGSVKEAAEILARDARLGLTMKQGVAAVDETLERTRWAARRVMAMQAEA